VLSVTRNKAVLEVSRDVLTVARRLVQMVFSRPFSWSVVPRPEGAAKLPAEWGTRYAVCPVCRTRAPLAGQPINLRCPRCQGLFRVAWEERYLRAPE
jgi:hypothetical protein